MSVAINDGSGRGGGGEDNMARAIEVAQLRRLCVCAPTTASGKLQGVLRPSRGLPCVCSNERAAARPASWAMAGQVRSSTSQQFLP